MSWDAGFDCATLAALESRMTEPLTDNELADVLDQYNAALAQEDALSQMDGDDAILDVLAGIGLPEAVWDVPFGMLSGGEKKMVGIARFLTQQPDVLLLDEPDNHLDVRAKGWLEEFLAHYPGAVGIITHDRYLIDRVATGIVELEDGKVSTWPSSYTAYRVQKRAAIERAIQLREVAERELARQAASRSLRSGPGRTKFASRAENMRRRYQVEKAKLEASPAPRRARINVSFEASRGGAGWW